MVLRLGKSAAEKSDRRDICNKYRTIEEITCICHRFVKLEEHVFTDKESEASLLFRQSIKLVNDVGAMVKSSNKNSQELTLVQEADPERGNRRIVQGPPKESPLDTMSGNRFLSGSLEGKTKVAPAQ